MISRAVVDKYCDARQFRKICAPLREHWVIIIGARPLIPGTALDIATGQVIGQCYKRHRSAEFRRFLDRIEAAMPAGRGVHVVIHA